MENVLEFSMTLTAYCGMCATGSPPVLSAVLSVTKRDKDSTNTEPDWKAREREEPG